MRTIMSHHHDEAALCAALFHDTPAPAEPFEFVTFECAGYTAPGELMRLVVCAGAQRVALNVELVGRRLLDEDQDQWEYLARVAESDRVWLEMMVTKLRTLRRFGSRAA